MNITNVDLLHKADQTLMRALENKDIATLSRLLTPKYSFVSLGNERLRRAEYLESLNREERVLVNQTWIQLETEVFDSCAFMQGRMQLEAIYRGVKFVGEIWCSRGWVNEEGFWKLSTMHVSDARLQAVWQKLKDHSGEKKEGTT